MSPSSPGPVDGAVENRTLTAVSGIEVGHAFVPGGGSGCTVVLGPFRAGAQVMGMATGSRELNALDLEHLVPRADAILLTGGSAFGLAAADGVMAWLAERDRGYRTRVAPVPIVPAAVIYDLAEGVERPGPAVGRAACDAAGSGSVREGRVGAGAGASVGKLGGRAGAAPGGVGSAYVRVGAAGVGALAVVNALGDILNGEGRVVAGGRRPDGTPLDYLAALETLAHEGPVGAVGGGGETPTPGTNTTLCVVATELPLGRTDLARLARMAATALPRRIRPVNTPFDGDVVFALSTAAAEEPVPGSRLLAAGEAARQALEESITRAVEPHA
jgi:L-aminopeptidase/D-esterase-like protein